MTLTRYQIRNEYGLANKEVYQTADKEDPEALLDSVSMAGLVGVLRQLGDLAEFAAEVFHCLHEELVKTAARGNGLTTRLQKLEAEFPSIEIPILSQTDHSTFFYDPGLEWHSNLQTKANLIAPHNLPRCIMDSYEECRGPPQLFLLDKFDVAGSGSCLKRYSDPSFLKTRTASTVVETSKHSKDERPRKPKKKASQKIEAASRTSHSKLHHLFLLEHVENGDINPDFHVKLKRRQLNGSPNNSSSHGTSYMEKFLKNSSLYCERVQGTLDQSSPAMETEVRVYSVQEDLPKPPLVNPNKGEPRKHNEMEMESVAYDDHERREMSFVPQEIMSNEKSLPNIEGEPERSSSVNNDTDATVSMEKEAESDDSNIGFLGFRQAEICINADETQTEVLAPFSNVLHQSVEEEEEEAASLLCTDCQRSSCSENPPNLLEESENRLELQSNEIELKSSEACEIFVEDKTEVLLTNNVEDHHHHQSQHVSNVETESEISLSGLVEEDHQFSSLTNQEITALEPEDISFEAPVALEESDSLLPNQYISPFYYTVEDSSLVADDDDDDDDAQDNVFLKEDETNSHDGSDLAAISEDTQTMSIVADENGTLMSDTPKDLLHTGNGDLLAESLQEDTLANTDLAAAISSYSEQEEDPQNMSIVAADESSDPVHVVPIPDTHFAGDVDHNNQTEPERDEESHLDTQEYLSSEYCIGTQLDKEQQGPSDTESAVPMTESAEFLPYTQDDLHFAGDASYKQEESLLDTQECLSSEYCIDTQDKEQQSPSADPITESAESLPHRFSTQDAPESMFPFSMSFHETPLADHPEITPPLPPLPPTQWLMGKLIESVKTAETRIDSTPSLTGSDENLPNGLVQEIYESQSSENHQNIHVYTEETAVEADIQHDDESTLECLNKAVEEESFGSSVSLLAEEEEEEEESRDQGFESDWRSEAMALEWFSQNLREHTNPQPQLEETEFPRDSDENHQKYEKLSKEDKEDSFVIGIDRSMLRKVSERNRTEVEARVDENDSLLQIIRNKSFNLRPADASARPNFKVAAAPITNFKVAAILEKANTLRQAMAGSDDEHDSDSWSE